MTATTNPLLRKNKLPGQTFRLPSRGKFYKLGELDEEVVDGEVVMFPMTTIDDIYMKSPDMLYQGTAIEKVISRCCPQVRHPKELLSIDIDYILVCLRKISYGQYIPIKYNHACTEKSEDHEYNIPVDHFILNSKEITEDHFGSFLLTVSSGEKIQLKPPTFNEIVQLEQVNIDKIKYDEFINHIFAQLCALIESVDGHTVKPDIMEWLKETPPEVWNEIRDKVSRLTQWGPEFTYDIKCKDCGKSVKLTTPLNPVAFFTLPSSQKTVQE